MAEMIPQDSGGQYFISYYNGFHQLCADLFKSYRYYLSTYILVLTILSAVSTQVVAKPVRIIVSLAGLVIGVLFFYRVCTNLSMEKGWLAWLKKMQEKLKACSAKELRDLIKPYESRTKGEVTVILRIFYIPLFLCVPCLFLGYYVLDALETLWLRYLLVIGVCGLLLPAIMGEFIRSRLVADDADEGKNEKGVQDEPGNPSTKEPE